MEFSAAELKLGIEWRSAWIIYQQGHIWNQFMIHKGTCRIGFLPQESKYLNIGKL